MVLAKGLGFFTTISIKKGYAANTELKTVREYNRIFIYINQNNLEIPVLLERKKFKCLDKIQFYNPKILINKNILTNRIIWSDFLDNLLIKNINIYQSTKGKKLIPWKIIQTNIKEFDNYSPDALRKRFETIR